jgi:hypothetical protein
MPDSYPSLNAYCKSLTKNAPASQTEISPRTMHLVAVLIKCSMLGIADDPESAIPTLKRAWYCVGHNLSAIGLKNVEVVVPPLKWCHRPADTDRAAWLEATSRLLSHAEFLSTTSANLITGTAKLANVQTSLCVRLDNVAADLLKLCGALKLSPREIVEHP